MQTKQQKLIAAVGALFFAIIAILIVWATGLPSVDQIESVYAFSASSLSNEMIEVDENTDRPIVLNFWYTSCPPCIVEMPRLEAAYQDYQDEGLLLVGINPVDSPAYTAQWAEDQRLSFPIVMDPTKELQLAYDVRAFPTTLFIDRSGNVQYIHLGPLSESSLEDGLAKIGLR